VRPQDDLYRYVNGRWMDTTPMPDDRVSYSASTELTEKTNADIRAIIEDLAAQPNRRAGFARAADRGSVREHAGRGGD
jgi:predicted metalloendopeptidase